MSDSSGVSSRSSVSMSSADTDDSIRTLGLHENISMLSAWRWPRHCPGDWRDTILLSEGQAMSLVQILSQYPFIVYLGFVFWRSLVLRCHPKVNQEPRDMTSTPDAAGAFGHLHYLRQSIEPSDFFSTRLPMIAANIPSSRVKQTFERYFYNLCVNNQIDAAAVIVRDLRSDLCPIRVRSIKKRSSNGSGILVAAKFGHAALVDFFLTKMQVDIETLCADGGTPLHFAAKASETEVVRLLVKRGANVEAKTADDETPLHMAARAGSLACVKVLVDEGKADVMATSDGGTRTPLRDALQSNHVGVASYLLEKGASVERASAVKYLHSAAANGQQDLAELLLSQVHFYLDVDARKDNGRTALHQAAISGHDDMVRLLLHKGAALDSVSGGNKKTALWYAASAGFSSVVQLLVESGADMELADNTDSETPLQRARYANHVPVVKYLALKGADLCTGPKHEDPFLHWAVVGGHFHLVKLLLKTRKVDPRATDKYGRTALHRAAKRKQVKVVKLLLKYDCLLDEQQGAL